MVKRKKSVSSNECLKLKNEMIVDKVSDIIRNHPDDFASKLKEFCFEYYEEEDFDAIEENAAKPENRNQQDLIDYFENGTEVSEKILEKILHRCLSDARKYRDIHGISGRFLLCCMSRWL